MALLYRRCRAGSFCLRLLPAAFLGR